MHILSYDKMAANVKKYLCVLPDQALVVDIGSMDLNGSYRPLIEPRWKYCGVDMTAGPNVDLVMHSEFNTGLPTSSADAVLCGQCLEHCRNPLRLMTEIARIAKPGAILLIVAPFIWAEHRHPLDCWRFLPDGMRVLLEQVEAECLETYIVRDDKQGSQTDYQINGADCWGIGKKRSWTLGN
jgi:SAM-dependent methyltransferase